MPTWFTGLFVTARIARSAGVLPRNNQTSPVRVWAAASSNDVRVFGAASIDVVTYSSMRIWKWVGLAGIVGVAAIGITAGTVALKRPPREFIDVDHQELHLRLQQRLVEAQQRRSA